MHICINRLAHYIRTSVDFGDIKVQQHLHNIISVTAVLRIVHQRFNNYSALFLRWFLFSDEQSRMELLPYFSSTFISGIIFVDDAL